AELRVASHQPGSMGRCVLKGPKMLHWLPALSGLVATRPGLRIALGTATILLVFAMAITSNSSK
uniref:hypothetical protein n=1 Tax=Morganella morganii TaxID=582 RepID=UPI00195359FF